MTTSAPRFGGTAPRGLRDVFGTAPDLAAELTILQKQLDQARATLTERIAVTDYACRIYDAHVDQTQGHSCLGCNLNVAVAELTDYLGLWHPDEMALTRLHLSLHLINTLWERMSDVCATLEVPKRQWCADERSYAGFKRARRWTNFLKHPGFFGLGIHHPIYVTEGGDAARELRHADTIRPKGFREWILIDDDFVREHWGADHGTGARGLKNAFTAAIVLPDPAALSIEVCSEFEHFVDQMTEPTWVREASAFAFREEPLHWW